MELDKSRAITARVVGSTMFFYIATSITGTILFERITEGEGIAAKFANIAQHSPQVGLTFLLAMLTIFEALILAVALYVLTRDQHADLALFALTCRVVEGVLNAVPAIAMLALLSVASQASTATGSEAVASNALGNFLLRLQGWTVIASAPVFGVGSALFYYLLARSGSVPKLLGYFGVLSSTLLVIAIPLEPFQVIQGAMSFYIWVPSLAFELLFAPWLIIKGVAARARP